ncbi:MAG: recombinase family protein [Sulfurimonadaceae bacterium]|jgi:DNA invertase Pin-like site-specific DNA recombinase|nr:recombinase family protein [Sulfurimonadaceae bacterium]
MTIAYIRQDKLFEAAHEQLQLINSYAVAHQIVIDDEYIDHTSQNKRLLERTDVTGYFQSKPKSILLVYDVWVLSTNMEDLIQMFTCLLKNDYNLHIVKQSVIISQQSSIMLVLGLIDGLRQKLQNESKRMIGRPKGSRSSSKFDQYINQIVTFIQEEKSVSEMARLLGVSRSSLKDYIESRELKEVAFGSLLMQTPDNAEEQVISKILCPNE